MKIINAFVLSSCLLSLLGCGGTGDSTSSSSSSTSSESVSSTSTSSAISTASEQSSSTSNESFSSTFTESSSPQSVSAVSSVAPSSSSVSTGLYPSYNLNPLPADDTGMASTAVQIASRIALGINFGNTMEASGGETAWGNPLITEAQIKLVKDHGFDAIRLPVSWNQYANQETAEISATWLNQVKQVVQYAVDNELYVIVNIHWDGGWLENNIDTANRDAINAKQKAFWEQIATQLRDFDERVLFASANEPNVENAEEMAKLDSYHQTFVDAVRSTGGKNSHRVLVLQGPKTDIEKTDQLWNGMPDDTVADKLMAEIHFYTPFNFTLMTTVETWGKPAYYWGNGFHSTTDTEHNATWGEEALIDQLFTSMKTKFVDQGIPVVLGEYSAMRRDNLTGDDLALHLASRAYYFRYVTERARTTGLLPFVWDTGSLFNRRALTVSDQQVLDALLLGAGKEVSSSSSSYSSTSRSSSSAASSLLTLDVNSSNWEAGTGVVMNQTGSEIQLTLNATGQEIFYNIPGPINLEGSTFTVVFNFDSAFVTAVNGGMAGILQFVAFEKTGWTSDYTCWTGWKALVAGQDIAFSCSTFTKSNTQPEGARVGVQFFSNTGTVTIKSATLELAQ